MATRNTQAAKAKEAAVQEPAKDDAPEAQAAKDGTTNTKAAKGKAGETPALFVRTRRGIKSRRRAGFRFTREGHGIALDALSDEQIEQLRADPGLEVEECTFPTDEAEE